MKRTRTRTGCRTGKPVTEQTRMGRPGNAGQPVGTGRARSAGAKPQRGVRTAGQPGQTGDARPVGAGQPAGTGRIRNADAKPAAGARSTGRAAQAAADRQARFRALITGEYRAEFEQEVERALRNRQEAEGDGALRRTVLDGLARAQQTAWQAQETAARAVYPELSLAEEVQNPDFLRLLTDPEHPMTVRRAYEAVHLDEIRDRLEREAAYRALAAIRARANRPREGGAAPQAGMPLHTGASTPAERAALARRAAAGEHITL